ncbi:MAG: ribosome maturation factor RimM [Bacteriovoracaceae bacterium]|nr:ribosome maturation factor RimM [Bacteriovoracaceae bacterium]
MNKEELVKLAYVAHPHGIKGEAEVRLVNPNPEESILDDGMKVWLFPTTAKSKIHPQGEQWNIVKIRFGNKVICQLEGIKDRTHLESLIPFEIYLAREEFPEPEDDEVYLIDMIDMTAVSETGETLGKVESFSDNGMQYLLNIRMNSGEVMTLPFVDAFFPDVDVEKKEVVMILPEYSE